MRTSTAVIGAAAGLVLAFGIAGTAGDATAPAAATPTTPGRHAGRCVRLQPDATPGRTVHVDGTCALPASGPMPTVVSVTSPAFTGPENFSKTDADAFDGTATIRSNAVPGTYTVTLTCSNGTATTDLRVVAAHGGGSGGSTGGNSGASSGTIAPAAPVAPGSTSSPPAEPGDPVPSRGRPEDLAVVASSGGTTGAPKGSWRTFAAYTAMVAVPSPPDRRQLASGRLAYLTQVLVDATLLGGGCVVLADGVDPAGTLAAVERERITDLFLVEPQLFTLMDHPDVRRRDLSSLRSLVHIGALAPPVLRERARHRLGPVVVHEQGKPNRVAIAALPRARQLA